MAPDNNPNAKDKMRLVRFLARTGVASRRGAAEFINSGRIAVNGKLTLDLSTQVGEKDLVQCDGKTLALPEKTVIMLNKPSGAICSLSDPHAEYTVMDIVKLPQLKLIPVGRLDKDSTGLLLMTNDGDYANHIMHPRYGIAKTYEINLSRALTKPDINTWLKGITDDGEILRVNSITTIGKNRYQVTLVEGKNRELRRLAVAVGTRVQELTRTAIGKLQLGKLPTGKWRKLSAAEISQSLLMGSAIGRWQ